MRSVFQIISTIIYLFAAITLTVISLMIMGWSVYEIIINFPVRDQLIPPILQSGNFIPLMLQSVGSIIIAAAIIDVAKYMIEEEVFLNKELREPAEARKTITKMMNLCDRNQGL